MQPQKNYPSLLSFILVLIELFLVEADVSTILITQTSASSPVQTSSQYTSDSDFKNALVAAHNFFRDEHNASALAWNDTSATYAAKWAAPCAFKHSVRLLFLFLVQNLLVIL